MTDTTALRSPAHPEGHVPVGRRWSAWLMAAAMLLAIGLKSYPPPAGVDWHWLALAPLLAGLFLARLDPDRHWWQTGVLLAYLIILLHFTEIDGRTDDAHIIHLTFMLGIGALLVPAIAAWRWMGEPLDYQWVSGRWSLKMWLWLVVGFALAFLIMGMYFTWWTPELHRSWYLPEDPTDPSRADWMWRLFWGCNFVGIWDELCFVNFVFVLLARRIGFREALLVQAVFFTSFLHEMAFVGWGPVVIFAFAMIQGYTYHRTRSLLYVIVLHLMIDTILFYWIANRYYPGWGWHPG
ncbi:CPBP family intramembrane metalloprotease [bacterium]|nr:CPBP family intramembrane metalloprotease [bacterium]